MAEAALAVARDDAREVVRAVADERGALLAQRGQHELAHLAVGHGRTGVGIDHFHVHVIVPNVHAVMLVARYADARAVHLGQAVDVVDLHAQLAGDALAHLVAPPLAADDALAQADAVADAALGDLLGQQQRVGAGGAQHGGFEVLHHAQLLLGIARPHGDSHGAQALGAQLEADARRPQAVAGGDMDAVAVRDARRLVAACELDGPVGDVLLRVGDDDRRARGAAGAVDAHDLLVGHGLQAQRIGVAQVVLLGERKLLEVLLGLHIGEVDALELGGVKRRALLQRGELLLDEGELVVGKLHDDPLLGRWSSTGYEDASSPRARVLKLKPSTRRNHGWEGEDVVVVREFHASILGEGRAIANPQVPREASSPQKHASTREACFWGDDAPTSALRFLARTTRRTSAQGGSAPAIMRPSADGDHQL